VRVVLDTNVLVSALLSRAGIPAEVLRRTLRGELIPLFDERIFEEYREVLARPKLKIDPVVMARLLESLSVIGEPVKAVPLESPNAPDPDDLAFLEVAVTGRADALVTGNARHFPDTRGVELFSPRALLERLGAGPGVGP
jgi:putative PIN family toxin of toxin-antitoxin system